VYNYPGFHQRGQDLAESDAVMIGDDAAIDPLKIYADEPGYSDTKISVRIPGGVRIWSRRASRHPMGEVGDTEPQQGGDRLSTAEIHDSTETISDADMARLIAAAAGFSRLCRIDADDLLQEAFARALEGRRTCERGTPLVDFLCGVMRSFVSQENEARKEGFRPVVVMRDGEPVLPDVASDDPSPERAAISAIDQRPVLDEISAAAAGDEQLQLLIEGIYEQMRGAELQELLGVDEKGLAAVRKRFRRLLQSARIKRVPS
jgi:DNA-directed RNA polymerase specialized sigma24 family protein